MKTVNDCYEEGEETYHQWRKDLTILGEGVSGKCYLAKDAETSFTFVTKLVSILYLKINTAFILISPVTLVVLNMGTLSPI